MRRVVAQAVGGGFSATTRQKIWRNLYLYVRGLPSRGVGDASPEQALDDDPPFGLRNHVCEWDGHEDPDNTGRCIYCGAIWV